ncbi:hypothetical protein ACQ859_27505 [Roseateles chitinivorans]|uniref:hypothetical protein n=1 Tax=Roseateles chitinivorans TaxID=2917965 RepID=UPI003D67729B
MTRKTVAVVVGRWQLVHLGQEALFQAAFGLADEVIAVLGSSYKARDPRNPFVHDERRQMLLANLTPEQQQRLHVLPVRDYFDDKRWNAAVTMGVRAIAGEDADIVLVGHQKDHTSYYLNNFPRWRQQLVERLADVDATAMRQVFFEADDPDAALTVMTPYVSAPVRAWLQAWSRLPEYRRRKAEHAAIASSQEIHGGRLHDGRRGGDRRRPRAAGAAQGAVRRGPLGGARRSPRPRREAGRLRGP